MSKSVRMELRWAGGPSKESDAERFASLQSLVEKAGWTVVMHQSQSVALSREGEQKTGEELYNEAVVDAKYIDSINNRINPPAPLTQARELEVILAQYQPDQHAHVTALHRRAQQTK